jgi:hypothetical protein
MTGKELQATWRSLIRIFPVWAMPAEILFSKTTWRYIGADLLAGPFGDRKSQKVADIVGALPVETVAALKTLAEVNVRRTSAAFSAVAVAYVSLPVAIGALLSEIAPEVMRELVFSDGSVVIAVLVGLAFGPLTYFGSMWRARQLEWTIELVSAGAIAPNAALPQKGAGAPTPKAPPG